MPFVNFNPDELRHLVWFEPEGAQLTASVLRGDYLDGVRCVLPVVSGPGDEVVVEIRTYAPGETFDFVRHRHTGRSEVLDGTLQLVWDYVGSATSTEFVDTDPDRR